MAKYLVRRFNKKGKEISSQIENLPTDLGRWQQSQRCDRRDGSRVRLHTKQTKDNNRIGVGYYCQDPDGTRTTFRLVDDKELKKLKKK